MFWSAKPLLGGDLHDWIVDHFDWVTKNRPDWHDIAQLITPTRAFFDAQGGQDHATALAVMRNLQDLLGIDAKIDLQPLNVLPDGLRHEYGKMADVAGQFIDDGHVQMITYDTTLLRRPALFISVMAHELMHSRLVDVVNDLPGGEATHELATDLHCIIAGFGLFQLEASEDAGWSGYMTQPSRAVALAMFLRLHDLDIADALPFLSKRTARWLRKAWAEDSTSAP